MQRLRSEKCAFYETTYSATLRDNHESTRCPATYTSVKRLIERLFNFAFRSERKATKHFFLQRLEDAIKLHRDDQGQAVINPASLALFATSSRDGNKIRNIREANGKRRFALRLIPW